MGEVYRARDTDLSRDVALKIVTPAVAHDPERLMRFTREAQVLASLNHPNIAHIYGLAARADSPGDRALVMELVEGQTLADRLKQGPLSMDDAVAVAMQMADALEAAHALGIIHRDLKPANIKIRPDGTVKVLDFGLAKALDPSASDPAAAMLSTVTSPALTERGVILGTAAYMSPEQAAGRPLDRRTDIWSFGVVLFELLTAKRLFHGEDVANVLAAVLKSEPDWTTLPVTTPPSIRRLLRRCLQKDRRKRLADISDARLELQDAGTTEPAAPVPSRWSWWPIALAFATGALIVGLWFGATRSAGSPAAPSMRFALQRPADAPLTLRSIWRSVAISPDGRQIAYIAGDDGSGGPLMLQSLDDLEAHQVPGVKQGAGPFFSPDGTSIGYRGDGLQRVSLSGGTPALIVEGTFSPRGATWADDGSVIYATSDSTKGLFRVPPGGGAPVELTTLDAAKGDGPHVFPSALPGGRGVLFTILPAGSQPEAQVAVLDLRTGRYKRLVPGSNAWYVETGHLIYARNGSIRAVPFDLDGLRVTGDSWLLEDRVVMNSEGEANFAVSRSGTLAFVPRRAPNLRVPVLVDRSGVESPIPDVPAKSYTAARFSPDESQLVLAALDDDEDIFTWNVARRSGLRITSSPGRDQNPWWLPDGESIVFTSNRSGRTRLYRQRTDGTDVAEQIGGDLERPAPVAVLPNPLTLLLLQALPKTAYDLFTLPLTRGATVATLLQQPTSELIADFSPNGDYYVYGSLEDGPQRVFVRSFRGQDKGRFAVSGAKGWAPRWSADGREIFYLDDSNLMSVLVTTAGGFRVVGMPTRLFAIAMYDITAGEPPMFTVLKDGKRFVFLKSVAPAGSQTPSSTIIVRTNATLK
jgi:serine/threonine-protein kinase